jgi:hypothetical protein
MSRTREIGRFFAKTDSGKEYEIIQYQDYIDASTMDNPNAEVPGKNVCRPQTAYTLITLIQKHLRLSRQMRLLRRPEIGYISPTFWR